MSKSGTPSANPFPNTNWDFLLEKIAAQRCVLFLGPQALPAHIDQALNKEQMEDPALMSKVEKLFPAGVRTVEQAMHTRLLFQEPTRSWVRKFYSDLGFFLFHQEHFEPQFISSIRAYLRQTQFNLANELLKKVAQLPFHLIVTLTPDHLLQQAFLDSELDCETILYNKKQPTKTIEKPTPKKPLIYQLLGSIQQDESLLLTHNDLFDYFTAILHEYQLPHNLLEELKQAQSFVFLGLPFEKWYMQLLLRLFSIHLPQHKFNHLAVKKFDDPNNRDLWKDQFRIEFEETDEASAFVDELHSRCQEKGMLRTPEEAPPKVDWQEETVKVKTLVSEGDLMPAIEALATSAELLLPSTKQLLDDLILVSSKFKRHEREVILGIAERNTQTQQQTAQAILILVDELQNLAAE